MKPAIWHGHNITQDQNSKGPKTEVICKVDISFYTGQQDIQTSNIPTQKRRHGPQAKKSRGIFTVETENVRRKQ
jgi:hypothetical protein